MEAKTQVTDDQEFWEEFVSGLLNLVCIIERQKLKRKPDTAELRKAGKQALHKET